MSDWYEPIVLAEMRMRELRSAAEQRRRVREARGPRPLRRRVGQLLVETGERLAR